MPGCPTIFENYKSTRVVGVCTIDRGMVGNPSCSYGTAIYVLQIQMVLSTGGVGRDSRYHESENVEIYRSIPEGYHYRTWHCMLQEAVSKFILSFIRTALREPETKKSVNEQQSQHQNCKGLK